MKALVFAAGLGTRLHPLTLDRPKCLVEVGGMTMLERVMRRLIAAGVDHIVVNVHHFAPKVIDFLSSRDWSTVKIDISNESDLLLDTGGGLLKAAPLLLDGTDEPVIIHNADVLTNSPLQTMAEAHRRTGADATLLAWDRATSRKFLFDAEGRMHGWINESTGEVRPAGIDASGLHPLGFGGVHIINPRRVIDALERFATEPVFSITPFYISASAELDIRAFTPSEPFSWHDIGKPQSLEQARLDPAF